MGRLFRLQLLVLVFFAGFYAVYALAASDTNLPSAGEGRNTISGWAVMNVQYRLAEDAAKISVVEFDLDAPASLVQISLDSTNASFFDCRNIRGMHWSCDVNSQIEISNAK